jgi:hypothetical protein
MLRFVCENAIVMTIIALMTAVVVPIGLALVGYALRYAY